MLLKLFLLFTVVPVVELALLIQVGVWIGPLWTLLLVVTTGFVGAWMAKREGLAVLRRLQGELSQGIPPATRLMEGALVVAGGLFLVTPGVLTDVAGFSLIFPATRRILAPLALAWLLHRFQIQVQGSEHFQRRPPTPEPSPEARPPGADRHFDHPVR